MQGFRKAVWLVDNAGRIFTIVALASLGISAALVAGGVIRALSHLATTWLVLVASGLAVIVFVVGFVLVMQVLAEGLHISQQADSCWIAPEPSIDATVLTGMILISNSDPAQQLQAVSIFIHRARVNDKRSAMSVQGTISIAGSGTIDIPAGKSAWRLVHFIVRPMIEPPARLIETDVQVRDQFNRRHRGVIEFFPPPEPDRPTPSDIPASHPERKRIPREVDRLRRNGGRSPS